MSAAAAAPSSPGGRAVFLTGSVASEAILHLFGCSSWKVMHVHGVEAAARHIEAGSVPVVICGAGEWRDIVRAGGSSARPPAVIVLTGAPDDAEWMEALRAGAHYVDARNLAPATLFSLVSLVWRGWNSRL